MSDEEIDEILDRFEDWLEEEEIPTPTTFVEWRRAYRRFQRPLRKHVSYKQYKIWHYFKKRLRGEI